MVEKTKQWFKTSFLKLAASLKKGDKGQVSHWLHDITEEIEEEDITITTELKAEIKSALKKLNNNINNKNACYAIITGMLKKLE